MSRINSRLLHLWFLSIISISFIQFESVSWAGSERIVTVKENQLVVDDEKQPQLFGAEVQYFRLRGGYGPNISRERVLAVWNKALDYLVQAKMNAISFYIPWDFHEYAEGKFDFTGTADVDHDGLPDYPSRDIITFFKLIADRGITRIMVRPGPYINAEWGFLGFGAIPSWFHEKFPDSHMKSPYGLRTKLYDYHNENLIRYSFKWFKELNNQVLNARMGPGKPIIFLQLDNETNYQWQSIYNHDYGRSSILRYQNFLKDLYQDMGKLNQAHNRKWDRWSQVQPPTNQGRNIFEDQDWYRFADNTIYLFLNKIRNTWQDLGVLEPQVLFTLAESYNAPLNGILPNFVLRNAKDTTGLMTVNLYPKTAEEPGQPLLNFPFKADLDVKSADEANDSYFGSRQEWVLGPEVQGGWWRGINISPESRQQTYLTVLGHGMKAFFIYYFNEGQNWDVEWSYNQIKPIYDQLRWERRLETVPIEKLPEDFWNELQSRSDRRVLVGFDVRGIIKQNLQESKELYFDSPLDGSARPRKHYFQLKKIGERIVFPYKDFLARSLEVHDEVALVKDSTSHLPVKDKNIPSVQAAADWTGGLLGYLMNANINPTILHGELSPQSRFNEVKVLTHLDTGLNATRTITMFENAMTQNQTVINFLSDNIAQILGFKFPSKLQMARYTQASVRLTFYIDQNGHLQSAGQQNTTPISFMSSTPIYQYELNPKNADCEGVLYHENNIVGYRCRKGDATFIQIGALIFEDYNSSVYGHLLNPQERKQFLTILMDESKVVSKMALSTLASQTVAFARKDPKKELLWVTVKTGSESPQSQLLKISPLLLRDSFEINESDFDHKKLKYRITDLLSQKNEIINIQDLIQKGFKINLPPNGSTVYVLKPL